MISSWRLHDENTQFEETLNHVLRIDYLTVSLAYMNQQLAYQSSLQVTSMMFQMSLLNFLRVSRRTRAVQHTRLQFFHNAVDF